MPISVRDLLELPGLGLNLVAGTEGLDHSIRWAHTSELQDPTPWLSGEELLLTTGMGLQGSPALQRAYVRRLVQADVAGLGFGLGFDFDEVPPAIRKAADKHGFPVLEVPYPVPFIAIAEAVSSRLADDRLRDAQLSTQVHERLAGLVAGGAGTADVLEEVVALAGGWVILFDSRGQQIAGAGLNLPSPQEVWADLPQSLSDRHESVVSADVSPRGTRVGLAVMAGKRHEGILVFGKSRKLDQSDRLVVHHAVTVLGLLLASRRAVQDAERRLAGDVLESAFSGRLEGAELERRLESVGFSPGNPATVLLVEPGETVEDIEEIAELVDAVLGTRANAIRTTVIEGRVAALVAGGDPSELAQVLSAELHEEAGEPGEPGIAIGETVEPLSVRHSYLSALAVARAMPTGRKVASTRDLGSYGVLLGAQPRPVLEGFVRSALGPLLDRDDSRSSELVPSLQAFIEAGGRWEAGAEALGVHRHTLRYRVKQVEELLGRSLNSPEDRLELWLALKALEMLED